MCCDSGSERNLRVPLTNRKHPAPQRSREKLAICRPAYGIMLAGMAKFLGKLPSQQ
jgi:hypothetical protein